MIALPRAIASARGSCLDLITFGCSQEGFVSNDQITVSVRPRPSVCLAEDIITFTFACLTINKLCLIKLLNGAARARASLLGRSQEEGWPEAGRCEARDRASSARASGPAQAGARDGAVGARAAEPAEEENLCGGEDGSRAFEQ